MIDTSQAIITPILRKPPKTRAGGMGARVSDRNPAAVVSEV